MTKIEELAKQFCDAHKEDYVTLLNSDSMDVDADFMLLCHAIYGEPVMLHGMWAPGS